MKRLELKIVFAALLLLSGCMRDRLADEDKVRTYNLLETTVEISDMGGYVENVEIINLKGDGVPVVSGIIKLLICENGDMIFLTDNGLYKFDKEGTYKLEYGRIGRSQGEYIKIYDICIGFDSKELLCLTHQNEVLRYDLESGRFVGKTRTISGQQGIPNAAAIIPASGNGFSLYVPNPEDASSQEEFYCILTFDSGGVLLGRSVKRTDFNLDMAFIPFVTQGYGNIYCLRPQENENILYEVTSETDMKKGPDKKMRLFFGKDNIPAGFAFRDGKNPWENLEKMMMSDYMKVQFHFFTTADYQYSAAFGGKSGVVNFLVRKDTFEGIRWRDRNAMMSTPLFIVGADEKYLYVLFDKYHLDRTAIAEGSDPLLKYLVCEKNLSLDDDDNPVIAKIQFDLEGIDL